MAVILVIALMLVDTWSASGLAACAPVTHESRAYAPRYDASGPGPGGSSLVRRSWSDR